MRHDPPHPGKTVDPGLGDGLNSMVTVVAPTSPILPTETLWTLIVLRRAVMLAGVSSQLTVTVAVTPGTESRGRLTADLLAGNSAVSEPGSSVGCGVCLCRCVVRSYPQAKPDWED